ncbi:hypothetical protein ALHIDCOG_00408 [Klebsiella phage CPRSB]|nr:hypothetical protein ALHIDCOG_00408 [Klebsiella phage CPRSB]
MIIPPLNITIWATANDYTWFPICIMYMSDNANRLSESSKRF